MTQPATRRRAWPALLLAGALLLSGSLSGAVLAQDDQGQDTAESTPAVEPSRTPEPTPEPTPYPQFDPSTVTLRLDLLADSLEDLVYVTDDGAGGRCLYAVEKDGQVWLIDKRDGIKTQRPFLDLSGKVSTLPLQGLHSIAFHPNFKKNGRFFARYDNRRGQAVVAEFKGAPCRPAVKGGNKIVNGGTWVRESQDYPNNNAGWIGFGPDGKLYVPLGDGGGPPPGDPDGLGQNVETRLAKILRLDVDRPDGIADDNPYVKVVGKGKNVKLKARGKFPRETWARGVRDPRRASFDRKTGDFWFGDVGQDWQEVNLVRAGSVKRGRSAPNFGWSHVEGADSCHPVNQPDCDPSAYTPPIYAYETGALHRAITGGYVYRGAAIPGGADIVELDGVYLFSDFASGFIWGLDADAIYDGVEVTAHELYDAPQGFVSFGEDDEGELYLVALDGSIYRLTVEGS